MARDHTRGTGQGSPYDGEFARFFDARVHQLRSTAYLLCGDWHQAEDLTQATLLKLYLAWPRLTGRDRLDAYARQVLTRTFLAERRRPWRREKPAEELPDDVSVDGPAPEERMVVLRALAAVPPKQRAVLVLRFWQDLGVEETAAALSCSVGNVKSQTARGLATLRARLGPSYGSEVNAWQTSTSGTS
ncbi:SigE family RNA polymerase sigma factor [Amycolatopsis suaedae]|uniref:SigE family RNA polymerase sigma factor n=1 Tax=Amycolatopsis suaedae TaxID=2510978 RepID=A0A4Q7JAS5_9PSEU|nr:SigE family RNA polymerase sigma factor [Amycolatopsis suaedae]RZQ64379.1 SigE family RNA polymerase sigma factor [Amycolatopsis suaedae]